MVGRIVGSPTGSMAAVVAFLLGRVGGEGVALGGSGSSSVVGSGDAQIRIWESELVTVVLGTSW